MASIKASLIRALSCLAILALVSVSAYARESIPIVDYIDVPVATGSGQPLTSAQVRNAISVAALAKGWEVDPKQAGNMLSAKLDVRGKHSVTVSLPYSPDRFSIKYLSSVNLNYAASQAPTNRGEILKEGVSGVPIIHPYYNKWVQNLRQEILRELKKL